jgi:hypothetical protein
MESSMKRYLLAGAAALALITAVAAQQLAPTTFNGSEVVLLQVGGPGGAGIYATTSMLTNSTRGVTNGASTGTITWPGGTGLNNTLSTIVYTSAIGTMTQNLPANPFDGQLVEVVFVAAGTSWTPATTDGATIVTAAAVTPAANASAQYYYLKSTNTWYRMR